MYDELLKARLDNPRHYDRMISLIMQYNPACYQLFGGNREWACNVINTCIRSVTDGGEHDYATGCCMAMRTASGKVRLFLEPLVPIQNQG